AGINRSPVNLVDIFPTLCELTDLETPTGTEGKSLAPILQHSRDSVNEFAATIFPHDKHWGVAIRTERYRYIAWYKGVMTKKRSGARLKQKPQFTELYDYQSDPLERTNLSRNPSYQEIEEKLAKMNQAHVAATQNRQFSN
ncbi:sulfatase/phosphatase domain-containing protein, partial [Rhodopirellula sallentina]|uniref:sulfatase/phosphatase domain-containing protein n=1 Tax=Rhodopirellula sallentina TaxID=1263869 RepID=UPI0005C7AABA